MRSRRYLVSTVPAAVIMVSGLVTPNVSHAYQWTSNGPYGGDISSLVVESAGVVYSEDKRRDV
ncbi:MAG: hypothetical protein HQK57_05255 [Deltaproteobacteria bacterium]|nr:hypothetical protein [Deltaproteobacteria bacterium]MBF0526844.1 hypothetical protein [Deltaproteobacteria bacterium]